MTKKDFKELANMCAEIDGANAGVREYVIDFLCKFCYRNNNRFDEDRFREWVKRKVNGKSTKGLG